MAPERFADHFSGHAAAYARARPRYPDGLFAWLREVTPAVPAPQLAWDCGCGNGQAAIALAGRFDGIVATDASSEQLRNATPHARVSYAAATAERAPLRSGRVVLTVVAQALHWMQRDAFYAEVRRVSAPGAIIAAWAYGRATVDRDVDPVIDHFHAVTSAPFWPPERRHVDAGYATLAFPFARLAPPPLEMRAVWTRHELVDYIGTWSAVSRMRAAGRGDPLPRLEEELAPHWPAPERRTVRWPLSILAGRVSEP